MASVLRALNSVIPFADPSRALWRDILLSAVLCTILYVAPQIDFNRLRHRYQNHEQPIYVPVVEPEAVHNGDIALEEADANVEAPAQPDHGVQDQAEVEEQPELAAEPAQPARPAHQPPPRDPTREVGAKKAKAIERRNRQRAYNEFMREQGEAQRAEWARDDVEVQEQKQAEQRRRAAVEAKVREKEAKDREVRKANAEAERQAELLATQTATTAIETGMRENGFYPLKSAMDLVKRDETWMRELVRRHGILGTRVEDEGKIAVMLTKSGWIVKVTAAVMNDVYSQTAAACESGTGRADWKELGQFVQSGIITGGA